MPDVCAIWPSAPKNACRPHLIINLRELGYDVTLTSWWGGFVPSATPVSIVNQLGAWLSEIVKSDEGKKFLNGFASDPWASDPVSAQAYFRREIAAWGDYVRIAKIEKQG